MLCRQARFWKLVSLSVFFALFFLLFGVERETAAQSPPVFSPSQRSSLAPADFTPRIPPRALMYQRQRRTISLTGLGWGLGAPVVFVLSGLGRRLGKRLNPTDLFPPFFRFLTYFALFTLFESLWSLPFGLAGLHLEHTYGFSTQPLFGYLRDRLVGDLTGLILAPFLWLALRLSVRSPRHWWKIVWACTVPLLLVSIVLQPVLISPLYYRYTPMPPSPLQGQITDLAQKAGISGGRILIESTSSRTTHVNAYVTGLGPTTRIVLNDTALSTLPPDQTLAMMGHEMGHYVEGHLWFGFAAGSLGAGVFLFLLSRLYPALIARMGGRYGIQHPTDLSALPVLMGVISVFLLLQSPVASGLSRLLEHRADAFGLRVTGLHQATARLFVGFAERDYSDPAPPPLLHFWFGTHPTLNERIAFALQKEN